MVTIIMLSYNAPLYTKHALRTLKYTEGVDYEIIVLDNNSKQSTKKMLNRMKKKNYIDKLVFENTNTLFAKGNNTASLLCDEKSEYILLLNSDIEVRDKNWLDLLLQHHKRGAIAYGVCNGNPYTRGDGYNVKAIRNHNDLIYHYGGASGDGWKNAKGIKIEGEEVKQWFNNEKIEIIDTIISDKSIYNKFTLTNIMSKSNKVILKFKDIVNYIK